MEGEGCIDGQRWIQSIAWRREHSVGRQVDASDDLTYTHDSLSGGLRFEYLRCGC